MLRKPLYEPLGLKNVTFNPLGNSFKADGIAATGKLAGNTRDGLITFDNMRTDTIQGTVQRAEGPTTRWRNLWSRGSVCKTLPDLAVLVQTVMNRGWLRQHHALQRGFTTSSSSKRT